MRKLMWFSIGFAAACGLCMIVFPKVSATILLCILVFLLLIAGFTAKRYPALKRAVVVLLGCVTGLLWATLYHSMMLSPALTYDGHEANVSVTASDYSYETAYGSAVDGVVLLDGRRYRIKIYINESMDIEPGDTLQGKFRLRYTGPGGKEDATYHAGNGIFLLGYQKGELIFTRDSANTSFYPSRLAYEIKRILMSTLPADVAGFARALLLGDNTQLDYQTDTSFKISGIRHIIAVSGLHVAILYSLIHTVALKNRFLTVLLSFPVLFIFAAVAGFTPSVSRACLMIGLMILAQLFNREYDSPTALSLASLVMLLANPMVISSVSFQLSVGCVAGTLLFQTPLSDWLKSIMGEPKGKTPGARSKRWFISSVSATLGTMSLTTSLSAYYFGTVSLISVVTNLLTLWVVNLVFNGLVILCLMSLVSSTAAAAFGLVLAIPMRYVLGVSRILSRFPLAAVYIASDYIIAWIILAYVLILAFLLSRQKNPVTLISCGALGLCIALLVSWTEPLCDDVRMTVLDVGQGQSIILQAEGKTYLVDCGGSSDTEAADIAVENLLSQGISHLDGIILTHADADHSGGLKHLLSRISADVLLVSATLDPETKEQLLTLSNSEMIMVEEETVITFGAVKIVVIGPVFASERNENSLCVLFTRENYDILITGDRSELGEKLLLKQTVLPQVEVLVAGHHGSKYSTGDELLQAVRPAVVVISAAEDNAYGHPAPEVLERLESYGCEVRRTDTEGTIIIRR